MKPTILLLHGALNTSDQLVPLAKKLESVFEVFTLNFRGHDTVPFEKSLFMSVLTEDIVTFMDQLKRDRCHIFGYSMGGYAAVSYAAHNPQKLGKIITLGTKWDWNPVSAAKEVTMLDPDVLAEKVPAYVSKLQTLFGSENWKNVVLKTAGLMADLGNGGALTDEDFAQIKTDILILRGSEDKMVTSASSLEIKNRLQNATYREISGAPHPLEKVDINLLAEEIISFCV